MGDDAVSMETTGTRPVCDAEALDLQTGRHRARWRVCRDVLRIQWEPHLPAWHGPLHHIRVLRIREITMEREKKNTFHRGGGSERLTQRSLRGAADLVTQI